MPDAESLSLIRSSTCWSGPTRSGLRSGTADQPVKALADRALKADWIMALKVMATAIRATATARSSLTTPERSTSFHNDVQQLDPRLMAKYHRFQLDEKIVDARGRDAHHDISTKLYAINVSARTDLDVARYIKVTPGGTHPLEATYALVSFDAVRMKIQRPGARQGCRVAIGVTENSLEVLGLSMSKWKDRISLAYLNS